MTLVNGYIEALPETEFDGAICLLTLHFLSFEEWLHTLRELNRRLKPGAPIVIAHHRAPDDADEKLSWFRRWAAFISANGIPEDSPHGRANRIASQLSTLSPECEADLLQKAGFEQPSLFYAALTFRGWVVYAGS